MSKTITKSFVETTYGDAYTFRFEDTGAYWVIFILKHPPNPIGGGAHKTHILAGNQLCIVTGREPKTLQAAVACSCEFIVYFSRYIRTGDTVQSKIRCDLKDYNDDGSTR